jgi:hypothetical protein
MDERQVQKRGGRRFLLGSTPPTAWEKAAKNGLRTLIP